MDDDKDRPIPRIGKLMYLDRETSGLKSIKAEGHLETQTIQHQHWPPSQFAGQNMPSRAVNVLIIELDNGRKFRVEAQELISEEEAKGE
jgi:hypothetical protein